MEVTQEPDCSPRSEREHGSLLVLALLAFAVGGTSGLLGAVFRLVLERSDRFRGAVIDWAHGKEIAGFALVIGISAVATGLAAWLVRRFASCRPSSKRPASRRPTLSMASRQLPNAKVLAELLNAKPREIKSFLSGQLASGRAQELQSELLAAGIPL